MTTAGLKKVSTTLRNLRALLDYSDDDTLTVRQALTFMAVASRASGMAPQSQIEQDTGQPRNALSRSLVRLGDGTPREPGLGLLVSELDPADRRYRVIKLTDRGHDLARLMASGGASE
jgi:DNA-binding MarR family transcriptional regulator